MRGRLGRLALLALVALAASQVGAPCQPGGATVAIGNVVIMPVSETYYVGVAEIAVATNKEFQAVEFTLGWDAASLVVTQLTPAPDFDDDGAFSLPATFDLASGTTSAVVDVRHGPSVTGPTRVASVVFMAPQGLPGSLWVSGKIAAPDGSLLPMAPSDPVATP
jgi:hypothetical protein